MAVRYNPNPVRTQEPLCQVNTWDEVETSSLYTVECNGQAQTVYHTDSFDYVIPVVRDDSPLQVTVQVHKPFEEAVVRPAKAGILPKREGERLSLSLPRPQKLTLELDGDLKTPLYILCTHWAPKPEKVDHLFESGKIYNVGVLHVKAGETVYLEEG